MREKVLEVLNKRFGFTEFRGQQFEVIEALLEQKSCLVIFSTGAGKSLCYQLPALILDGLTIVISPLVALMQDQVQALRKKNIEATFINSSLDRQTREQRYKELEQKKFKILYVTPERFKKAEFFQALQNNKISLLAVDEAHCVSQWGQDFRPEYSRLGEIRQRLGFPTTVALTATATEPTRHEISRLLGLEQVFADSIERPNLEIHVHHVVGVDEKVRNLVGLIHQVQGPKVIYTSLISTIYKLGQEFSRLGIGFFVYHSEMKSSERLKNQQEFLESKDGLMLATPAFGLGVDKADIRGVFHAEVPASIEAYFQEIGRAGRDGGTAQCHLLYDEDDVSIQTEFIKWSNPDPEFIKTVYYLVAAGGPHLAQEGVDYLRTKMNFYNRRDFRVETALNLLERFGSLERDSSKLGFRCISDPEGDYLDHEKHRQRWISQNQKLLEIVRFAQNSQDCRQQQILKYFGVASSGCGKCDVCRLAT